MKQYRVLPWYKLQNILEIYDIFSLEYDTTERRMCCNQLSTRSWYNLSYITACGIYYSTFLSKNIFWWICYWNYNQCHCIFSEVRKMIRTYIGHRIDYVYDQLHFFAHFLHISRTRSCWLPIALFCTFISMINVVQNYLVHVLFLQPLGTVYLRRF